MDLGIGVHELPEEDDPPKTIGVKEEVRDDFRNLAELGPAALRQADIQSLLVGFHRSVGSLTPDYKVLSEDVQAYLFPRWRSWEVALAMEKRARGGEYGFDLSSPEPETVEEWV